MSLGFIHHCINTDTKDVYVSWYNKTRMYGRVVGTPDSRSMLEFLGYPSRHSQRSVWPTHLLNPKPILPLEFVYHEV